MLLVVIGSLLVGALIMRVFYVIWRTGKPCPDIYGKKASLKTLIVLGSGALEENPLLHLGYEIYSKCAVVESQQLHIFTSLWGKKDLLSLFLHLHTLRLENRDA